MYNNIFEYVTSQESLYNRPISLFGSWEWGMKEHIEKSQLYINSQFTTGNNDDKPFKNIIRPILNLQYWTDGFDLKDIELFINDKVEYYKSFIIRKFHEMWAEKNKVDTFIDEMVESYTDLGGVLVKKTEKQILPEVVPLESLAFCDQTDLESAPLAIKHSYSPDQLKEKEAIGWGNIANGATATIDEVIELSEAQKAQYRAEDKKNQTPGNYIEIYEIHGVLPLKFLKETSKVKYERQLHIITFYQTKDGDKKGICLFKGKEEKTPFKFLKRRKKIWGRALGTGGAEELFESQVWTNYGQIRIKEMLDAAAKTILKTTDAQLAARHPKGLQDVDNLEILELAQGTDLNQLDTFPRNVAIFERSLDEWEALAQKTGAASDAMLGESPTSGTPFKLQELVVRQGRGPHNWRRGHIADFLFEIYQDWIIPDIAKEITKGQEFLAELEMEELENIATNIAERKANEFAKERILSGQLVFPEELDTLKQETKTLFMKGGNKRFIEILKDELKKAPIDVKINIAGRQKDMSLYTDKLVNVFRQVISNPAVLDDPRLAKIFNEILESSGLSPINFGANAIRPLLPAQQPVQAPRTLLENLIPKQEVALAI